MIKKLFRRWAGLQAYRAVVVHDHYTPPAMLAEYKARYNASRLWFMRKIP